MTATLSVLAKLGKIFELPSNIFITQVSAIMILRPIIMLTDKAVPMDTRKYAATREFFTEALQIPNLFIMSRTLEYLTTILGHDRLNPNKSEAFIPKIMTPLKNGQFRKALKEYNTSKHWITNVLEKGDWSKQPLYLQRVRGRYKFASYISTSFVTAILTPFLNNKVIGKPVLKTVSTLLDSIGYTDKPTSTYNQKTSALSSSSNLRNLHRATEQATPFVFPQAQTSSAYRTPSYAMKV